MILYAASPVAKVNVERLINWKRPLSIMMICPARMVYYIDNESTRCSYTCFIHSRLILDTMKGRSEWTAALTILTISGPKQPRASPRGRSCSA